MCITTENDDFPIKCENQHENSVGTMHPHLFVDARNLIHNLESKTKCFMKYKKHTHTHTRIGSNNNKQRDQQQTNGKPCANAETKYDAKTPNHQHTKIN